MTYGRDDDRGGYGRRYGSDHDRRDERGFVDRAGDELRSWFGDDDAEQRRTRDGRPDGAGRGYARDMNPPRGQHQDGIFDRVGRWFEGNGPRGGVAAGHDDHNDYQGWRTKQIEDLDRDYHEYRQENRSRFETEFGEFRTRRQGQRASLSQVKEHFEVLGSDGAHVGKVDKVRGDRIILAKNDPAAGGHHHSIPSIWLHSVEGERVTISKTAAEARQAWTDLDTHGALFGEPDYGQGRGAHMLDRSFSGTY